MEDVMQRFRSGKIQNTVVVALVAIFTLTFLALPGISCRQKINETDKVTVDHINEMCGWLRDYRVEKMYFPESWDQLMYWKGEELPVNVYTGQPMIALESQEFDPDISPGNFFYARVFDHDGNVINYQVIVYGERGEVWRMQHSNRFAPK